MFPFGKKERFIMGTVYRATCPKCGYKEQFCLGIGLGGINLFGCIRALSKKEQIEIRKMHENREIASFLVENKLTECRHCKTLNKLKEKTIITITDQDGHSLVFGGQCRDCGRKLHIYDGEVDKDTGKVACPSCGESFLIISKEGHWD